MMFKTHMVVSLLLALITFPMFSLDKGIFLLVFLFGALLPDIDTPTSFIGKRVRIVGWLFSHRGIFHSVFMMILLSGLIWLIDSKIAFVFGLGYLTHLVIDMLNHEGIRLFYPFRFRIKGFIRTDGIGENLIFLISLVLGFILLFKQ